MCFFRKFSILWFLFSFVGMPKAHAGAVDVNLFYLSDALSISSESTNSRMFVDVGLLINLTKKGRAVVGWNYSIVQATDTTGSTEVAYNSTEMGPVFGFYIDKDKRWPIFAAYNLLTTATYSSGSAEEDWRGTSYRVSFGYQSPITETFFGGLFLNYYTSTFSESITNETTLTQVSNARAIIYPSFAMSYRFD